MGEIEKRKCPTCGEDNFITDKYCNNCNARLDPNANEIHGEWFISATKWIAILELICSVYMAIESWSKAGKINEYLYNDTTIAKQLKDGMEMTGVYFLVGGIIIFILLMAVHFIGKNVINIAKNQ